MSSPAPDNLIKMAAFIPLSSAARGFVAESCLLARALRTKARFFFAGEEGAATRDTILSLFPDGLAPAPGDLVIREVPLASLIENNAGDFQLGVLGPMRTRASERVFPAQSLAHILRDLPSSFLLLKECGTEGTRFRRLVCGVGYDDTSQELLRFSRTLCRAFFADYLCVVREVPPPEAPASERALDTELWMLRDFVAPEPAPNHGMRLDCILGREGEGLFEYAKTEEAQLLLMPAPPRQARFWNRLFDSSNEPYFSRLPCSLLLYRHAEGAGD